MKYNDNGTWKDIYVKTLDSLPTGAVIDYDGDTLPDGWVEAPSYSTDEVKTGDTWIDGKPIYRKVVQFTVSSTSTSYKTIDFGIGTSSKIISLKIYKDNNGYDFAWFDKSSIDMYMDSNKLSFKPSIQDLVGTWNCTIEYTKTTD